MPTGPHLMEVVVTSKSHTALAILVTLEELYNSHSPRVGLGLVYKAPYIKTASFSEAFFHLKSASDAEADKRITEPNLMFVGINKASKVIPLPYVQPLFLDVPTMSDITDSKKPWSPHTFRAFRLHRVIYTEGSTLRTQVAYPHLGGETKSHLLNFQKQQSYLQYCLGSHPVLSGVPPFAAAPDHPTICPESGDDRDSAVPPSPSPSTVCAPTAGKSKAGLPATPIQVIGESDTDSDKTKNLEHEVDSSSSTPVFPPKSQQNRQWKGLQRWCSLPQEGNNKEGDGG